MTSTLKSIRTDHVGGLPRPRAAGEWQAAFERSEISAAELEQIHRLATATLVEWQEKVGLPVLTDGELARRNFQESFGGAVSGFDALAYRYPVEPTAEPGQEASSANGLPSERAASGMPENGPAVLHRRPVTSRLRLVRNIILEEYLRTASLASTPVKVTLIGPDRIAQRFAHEESASVYADLDAFVTDVVEIERQMIREVIDAGCRYVQIDEPGYIVGPSNLSTLIESIPPYWAPQVELFHRRVGNPDTEAEFLWSRSPLSRVGEIRIPLLIAQGANDPRVKQAEAEQIVAALKAAGVEYEYVLFADEGHGFVKPENRLRFSAAERFLARHLGGRVENDAEESAS